MDQCHMYPCWINHIEKGANDQALRGEHSVHALEGTAWLHTPWNGFKDRQWRSQFKFNSPQKKRIKLPFWCLILFYRTTCSRENVCKSYRALQSFFFFFLRCWLQIGIIFVIQHEKYILEKKHFRTSLLIPQWNIQMKWNKIQFKEKI